MRGFLLLQCVLAKQLGPNFFKRTSTWSKEPSWEAEIEETGPLRHDSVKKDLTGFEDLSEIDQIKSNYRLPLNNDGKPAHIPSHNHFEINLSGLKESDKNDEGYFEYKYVPFFFI